MDLKNICTFSLILKTTSQMNRHILFFCLALIFSASHSYAQLSKKEKKEWKKKAKEYAKNPANLKQLLDDKQTSDNQVTTLNQKITEIQSSVSEKDAKIAELDDQLSQMRGQLTATKAELAQLKESPPVNPMDFSK